MNMVSESKPFHVYDVRRRNEWDENRFQPRNHGADVNIFFLANWYNTIRCVKSILIFPLLRSSPPLVFTSRKVAAFFDVKENNAFVAKNFSCLLHHRQWCDNRRIVISSKKHRVKRQPGTNDRIPTRMDTTFRKYCECLRFLINSNSHTLSPSTRDESSLNNSCSNQSWSYQEQDAVNWRSQGCPQDFSHITRELGKGCNRLHLCRCGT